MADHQRKTGEIRYHEHLSKPPKRTVEWLRETFITDKNSKIPCQTLFEMHAEEAGSISKVELGRLLSHTFKDSGFKRQKAYDKKWWYYGISLKPRPREDEGNDASMQQQLFEDSTRYRKALNMYRRERMEKERLINDLEKALTTRKLSQLPSSMYVVNDELKDIVPITTNAILGHGSYGECVLKSFRGMAVAVKLFKHQGLSDKAVRYEVLNEANVLLNLRASQHLPYLIGVSFQEIPFRLVTSFHGIDFKSITFYSVLSRKAPLANLNWDNMLEQLCQGLNEIHCSGYIHNDIKCDNVIIDGCDDGQQNVVIIDFGKSCLISKAGKKKIPYEDQKEYKEKFPWVADEVISGQSAPSIKSDIFSLGYLVQKVANGIVLSKRYARLISECTSKDVKMRPSLPRVIDMINGVR